jgi:hypothetical protein
MQVSYTLNAHILWSYFMKINANALQQRILTNTTVIISLPWNTYKKCLECAFPPGIFHLFFTDIYNYYSLSKFCDLLTENWNITLLLTEAGKSHQTHWWFLTFKFVRSINYDFLSPKRNDLSYNQQILPSHSQLVII